MLPGDRQIRLSIYITESRLENRVIAGVMKKEAWDSAPLLNFTFAVFRKMQPLGRKNDQP